MPWDCPLNVCEETARVCREIDSGRSVDATIRDHFVVLMPSFSPMRLTSHQRFPV